MKKEYLMIPGPTPVPHEIYQAMSSGIFNHRGPKFKALIEEVTEKLKVLFATKNDLFILTASGTGAMEAGVVNFVSQGEQVISLSNGAFGDRLASIARAFGIEVHPLHSEWGGPLDYEGLEAMLSKDKTHNIKAVLVVHNESSTGMMNDVEKISKIRGEHPALLIVDTVSSMGAVNFPVDEWQVDICLTGSQKALMLPPGLSFISVNQRAWEALDRCRTPRFYFDLKKAKDFLDKGQTPFTPAIPQVVALKDSLNMLLEEGRQNVYKRHYRMMQASRKALKALGLEMLVADDEHASRTVTAIKSPKNLEVGSLRSKMRNKYGVEIAGGQGKLSNDIFRIGHLGAITELDIITTIAALEMSLSELGLKLELGAGVSEAQKVIMDK